jgi:flagellar biosynthetic protein FliR
MAIDIDPLWAMCVYLLALRIGVLMVMTPIFSNLTGLVTVRVLLTLALSVVLVSALGLRPAHATFSLGQIIADSLGELLVGATLAFGVFAAFGALSVAGKVLDIQSGFGMGGVFDPVTRREAPLFATLLNMFAVVVFFGMGGHHAFLRGIAFSAQQVVPGAGLATFSMDAVLRQFGLMFSLGVALIAPVMFCLFIVEVCLAFLSRVLPQMNIFVVGVPVKIFAGLSVFALSVGTLGTPMERVYGSIFHYWEQVL